MNKKSLLISLFVLSLTGCKISYVIESETTKSEDDSIVLSEESQTSETPSLPSQNSEVESTTETCESQESLTPSQSDDKEERVKTVHFFNNPLMPSTGSNFEHETNLKVLINIFNQIESDFVTSDGILLEKCQSFKCDDSLVLQVGTSSGHGGFIFESKYSIKSVKIESSVYYKDPYLNTWDDSENPYWMYPVDNYIEVNVNGVVQNIEHETSEKPERHNLNFVFETATKEFSLFTTENSQRLFIYSMEFTYLA